MALDYEKLINYRIPDVEQARTLRDTMLYGLGVGLGADPTDTNQLKFVYEKDLQALPTMAVVMCAPHAWLKHADAGISGSILHGEQSFTIHKPLPVEGTFVGKNRVTAVIDKGPAKGALVIAERDVYDRGTGDLLCSLESALFCRGEGGFGGPTGPVKTPHAIPARAPDIVCDLTILPQAALIYRLSGDANALHADPAVAAKAGYPMPILHGLCTLGVAGHALLKSCCSYDPSRLKSMAVRFSAPMYPGECLRTEIWRDGPVVSFRSLVTARENKVVLTNGRAGIAA